jgi:integrase
MRLTLAITIQCDSFDAWCRGVEFSKKRREAGSGGFVGRTRRRQNAARKPGLAARQREAAGETPYPKDRRHQASGESPLTRHYVSRTLRRRSGTQQAENSEKQTHELRLRINQLLPVFGSRPGEAIRKNEIILWLSEQSAQRKWAASSRNRWQATFSLIFRIGIDNEKIERNPAARIRRKTEGGERVRFLSDAEEAALRKTIAKRLPEFLPHLLLSIHSGMRMSEQFSLRWTQVDFERRQIHLPQTRNGDPRTIPLNTVALGALKQLRGAGRPAGNAPVFPSVRGGEALQGSRGWFPTALEEAGVEGYTWHCNRHALASRLVMAGVDLRSVAELPGHRTLQMVMRYSHLAPEHQASAVERLVSRRNGRDTRSDTGANRRKPAKRSDAVKRTKEAV